MAKQEQEKNAWISEFEKNTLRRAEIEKRRKKKEKEALEDNEYSMQKKMDKKQEIQRRLEDRDTLAAKKQAAMIRQWDNKSKSTLSFGQRAI